MPDRRELKQRVSELLRHPDAAGSIEELCRLPGRRVVNPLLSFLPSLDESLKWRTVEALGAVVARLAEKQLEPARVVLRRLAWTLSDESGGIGWGAPEAMGEAMARSGALAEEFADVLIAFIRPEGNYLEYKELHPGVLWGIGRLAHARPARARSAATYLGPFLEAAEPAIRGTAVWIATALPVELPPARREALRCDAAVFPLYRDGRVDDVRIGELAAGMVAGPAAASGG